ncbi:uncharacterized protein si:ch211-227n13.3 isoform X2 [Notolabrus celidotus]|nr:uncharacterized protein si:ch211-227n13.3 isoform X2 [Notolabrus celidotus]XP_034559193.1 uncharacterized protein si:ch211-227n13.3 isoform X2 [Notolabrus celidotus]
MYSRRSSRTPKHLSPKKEVTQHRKSSKRQKKMGLKKSKASDSEVNTDKRRDLDLLDIIDRTHGEKGLLEEHDRECVEVTNKGVDQSDEECLSVNSSIDSGPSIPFKTSPEKDRPSQSLCSACRKLHSKAKRMKRPIKDKLLDNDPKSLTCDQWVLIKSWQPSRLPNPRGKLLHYLKLVKGRLTLSREGESSACPRPHTFLQRNLRQCARAPVKRVTKKNRKRKREDPWGSRATKQKRIRNNNQHQRVDADADADINGYHPTSALSSSPALEGGSDQEMDTVTVELIPCSLTLETITDVPADQNKARKKGGFRDLLAQLRGNSSMIVKETGY